MVMNITLAIISNKEKNLEVSVTMNYPSKKLYQNATCYRLLVIVYYWFLGYYDKVKI